jgi:hypothetical protein
VNSTSQLDLHPDADCLNAFVEQALAVPEREQILAHLAGCSRCRQVIYLAQQAAAEVEAPAWVPEVKPAKQPGKLFWDWRFAWVPAAALAAALALVVTFHPWRTTQMPELAKAVPLRDEAVTPPLPQERASAGAHKSTSRLTANSVAGNATLDARPVTPEKLAQEPAPSAALSPEPRAIAPSAGMGQAFLRPSMPSAQQENAAQFQPEPAVAAWQQEQRMTGTLSASANASRVTQKSMRMEAYAAHASRPATATSSGPSVAQQSQSAPSDSFEIASQQQLSRSTISLKAQPPKLPSGLAAVSRATVQHLVLKIDLAGTLFLSDDSGEHWEPIVRQWTGRAVEVRAKTGLSSNIAPAVVFELKNDVGSTWASADGKTWSAQ